MLTLRALARYESLGPAQPPFFLLNNVGVKKRACLLDRTDSVITKRAEPVIAEGRRWNKSLVLEAQR